MTQAVIVGPSQRGPSFYAMSVRMRFVVGKVARPKLSDQTLRSSSARIIPPVLHVHHLYVALYRRTNGKKPEPSLGNREALIRKVLPILLAHYIYIYMLIF